MSPTWRGDRTSARIIPDLYHRLSPDTATLTLPHFCIKYLNVHFLPSDDVEQYLIISNLFMTILTACDMCWLCCGQNSCFWGWLMIYGKYGFCCCISLRKCFTNSRTIVNSCIVADNKGVVVSIIILPLDLIRCSAIIVLTINILTKIFLVLIAHSIV